MSFPALDDARAHGRVLADNAAGTQLPQEALDRAHRFLRDENAQKGDVFARCEATMHVAHAAKATFAELIAVDPATIGTGANATTIASAFSRLLAPAIPRAATVVVTDADHFANVLPWRWLGRFGRGAVTVPVDHAGDLDEVAFARALETKPFLVALPWASNATGTRFDVPRLARDAKRAGAIVVVDGVQAVPHGPLTIPPEVDVAFFSAYKIFAPHFGFWYARPEFAQRFIALDGDDIPGAGAVAWTIETGTQNHEGFAGWLGTVDYLRTLGDGDLRTAMTRVEAHERGLVDHALTAFEARGEQIDLYGRPDDRSRVPVFAFNLEGIAPQEVGRALDAGKIEARVGDYYAPRLVRTVAPETGGVAVRLSFAHYNTLDDIDRCFAAIDALI